MKTSELLKRMSNGVIAGAMLAGSLLFAAQPVAAADSPGAVYVQTNNPAGNEIAIFNRGADGLLSPGGTVSTGGLGTGSGLGSQGAVAISDDSRMLFAVNAGSNEVSSFMVNPNGLTLAGKAASGGILPTSVTVHNNIVYVLNAGGAGNISGFVVDNSGGLSSLAGSTQNLSNGGVGANTAPAQVQFSPDGNWLAVTEKGTSKLLIFPVDKNGVAGAAMVYNSSGTTPFGFAFDKRGHAIVSEAFGGAVNGSAVSSYDLTNGGQLVTISPSVATHQTAACWIAVSKNGKYAYTTNAGSAVITGFSIDQSGALSLLNSDGFTAATGAGPVDMDLSKNSKYLYALNGRARTISVYHVEENGSLTLMQELSGMSPTVAGIAAQ